MQETELTLGRHSLMRGAGADIEVVTAKSSAQPFDVDIVDVDNNVDVLRQTRFSPGATRERSYYRVAYPQTFERLSGQSQQVDLFHATSSTRPRTQLGRHSTLDAHSWRQQRSSLERLDLMRRSSPHAASLTSGGRVPPVRGRPLRWSWGRSRASYRFFRQI